MSNEEATRPNIDQEESQDVQPDAQQPETQQPEAGAADATEQSGNEVTIESLSAEIGVLQARIADQSDSVLRAQAEVQNIRRRAERDVENAHKFALDKFSSDLLPVIDSLERALEAADSLDHEGVKGMKDGVELTLKMFVDTLAKHGVEQISPMGEPFNPEYHQAMSMVPNPDMEPNSVMAVMQKGYILKGRLVRPAMVVVSKAP